MRHLRKSTVAILPLVLAACGDAGSSSPDGVLATAGGRDLPVEAAAEILGPQPELPNQAEVARALADLWVQYFLLAKAAGEDNTLASMEVDPLVDRQVEGELVAQLRERVIQIDTLIPEEELRARYEEELPGGRIRARHILLQFPEGATEAQEDSVRALAASIRERALEGEDFGALAQEYSQDVASAASGGDLGSFGKNEMVPPFEEAAFAMAEGEISDIVETAFGLHVIRVDERIVPPFEEQQEQYRAQVQSQAVTRAESTYVANVAESAEIQVDTGSFEAIKELAGSPDMRLASRALDRALARYNGGTLTLGEFRTWLLTSPPNVPPQIAAASDDQLDNLVEGLTRSELLVNQAREEGLEVAEARRDSLADGIIQGVRGIAEQLGLLDITPMEGETYEDAADRAVREILRSVVQEGREVFPLQTVAFALREQYGARIYTPGVDAVVAMVDSIRSEGASLPGAAMPVPMDTPATDPGNPDTTGGGL